MSRLAIVQLAFAEFRSLRLRWRQMYSDRGCDLALQTRRTDLTAARIFIVIAFAWAATSPLHGQDDAAADHGSQQPRQRIVRLSDVEGGVRVLSGGATEFDQAYQNMPLTEGTRIETGDDGRAEIEFEDGSLVRLAPDSAVVLDQLAHEKGVYVSAVRLASGLAYLELRSSLRYSYLINYIDGEFSPVQNSTVRVNLDVQPADVAVLDGDIRVVKQDAYNVEVRQGESLDSDPADSSRYFLSQAIAPDSWDDWNNDRDQAMLAQAADTTSARDQYAGDVGYGWSDLDAAGNWYPVPGYGLMWQPSGYGDNFDPYGNGVWAQYPTYGYVWVSGYPWGWTPFQCGSWSYAGGFGWGWMPTVGCGSYAGGWGSGFYGGFNGYRDGDGDESNRDRDRGRHNNVNRPPNGYQPPRRPIVIAGHAEEGNGDITVGGPPRIIPVGRGAVRPGARPADAGNRGSARQPIIFQGRSIAPLKPVAHGTTALAAGVRSGLARDYPVNARSGKPEVGIVPAPATGVASDGAAQGIAQPPIYTSGDSGAGSAPRPIYMPRGGQSPGQSPNRGAYGNNPGTTSPWNHSQANGSGRGSYTPPPRTSGQPPQHSGAPAPSRPSAPAPAPRPSPPPAPTNPH